MARHNGRALRRNDLATFDIHIVARAHQHRLAGEGTAGLAAGAAGVIGAHRPGRQDSAAAALPLVACAGRDVGGADTNVTPGLDLQRVLRHHLRALARHILPRLDADAVAADLRGDLLVAGHHGAIDAHLAGAVRTIGTVHQIRTGQPADPVAAALVIGPADLLPEIFLHDTKTHIPARRQHGVTRGGNDGRIGLQVAASKQHHVLATHAGHLIDIASRGDGIGSRDAGTAKHDIPARTQHQLVVGIDDATGILDITLRQEANRAALNTPAEIADVVRAQRHPRSRGDGAAAIEDVLHGLEGDFIAGDQGLATTHPQARRLQIDLRHQHFLLTAIGQRRPPLYQPDDVRFKLGDLCFGECDAQRIALDLRLLQPGLHQRQVLRLVVAEAVQIALAGGFLDLPLDQLLLVEAITETLVTRRRTEAVLIRTHQEVGRQPVALTDEARIGLHQWCGHAALIDLVQGIGRQVHVDGGSTQVSRLARIRQRLGGNGGGCARSTLARAACLVRGAHIKWELCFYRLRGVGCALITTLIGLEPMFPDEGLLCRAGGGDRLPAHGAGVVDGRAIDGISGQQATGDELAGVVVDHTGGQGHRAAGGDHAGGAAGDDSAPDLLGAVVDDPLAHHASVE